MGRVLVVCAIVVAAMGCRSQTTAITNPFLQPDRVPPPATRLPAPGAAAPYYGADPTLPGAAAIPAVPATVAAPTYAQPAYAQPSYSPTTAPPATAYPGSAYPLTPAAPGGAPTVPPGGWGGYPPQSSVDTLVPPTNGGVLQRLQPREITPAEYQQNSQNQFVGSTPASTLAATTPTASDGFRPQGSTPLSTASTATPSPTSLAFRQGLAGGSEESTAARFARGDDYDWLRGQLEYWPETGQWSLRYTDAGAQADGFGGRMAIENPQVLGNLPPGEFVKLRGQMYQRDNGDSTWAPAYRVATVERQRM